MKKMIVLFLGLTMITGAYAAADHFVNCTYYVQNIQQTGFHAKATALQSQILDMMATTEDDDVREKLAEAKAKIDEAWEKYRNAQAKQNAGEYDDAREKSADAHEKLSEAREKYNEALEKRDGIDRD